MGTSKLTSSQFTRLHFGKDTEMVEFKTPSHCCRSLIENDGSSGLLALIIDANKTTYLRKLLDLMKQTPLIDEFSLRSHGLMEIRF